MTTEATRPTTDELPIPTSFRSAIAERLHAASPTLEGASRHLLGAGGKGIRPRVLRLIARMLHPTGRVLPCSTTSRRVGLPGS